MIARRKKGGISGEKEAFHRAKRGKNLRTQRKGAPTRSTTPIEGEGRDGRRRFFQQGERRPRPGLLTVFKREISQSEGREKEVAAPL